MRVYRIEGDRLFAAEVALQASGERLLPSYTAGDNRPVVATDTMKNFLLAQSRDFAEETVEDFLVHAGARFLAQYPHIESVRLVGREIPFSREQGVVFSRRRDDVAFAEVLMDRSGVRDHRLGRRDLRLIKLRGSAFAGFLRDEYTTLPEMADRPLFIHLDAAWRCRSYPDRVDSLAVRALLIETFDGFVSHSIQHLLHEMGRRVLERYDRVVEIAFEAQNRLWTAAGGEGQAKVFTDPPPPYGVISLTLRRDEAHGG